jgi:hypothetical protein
VESLYFCRRALEITRCAFGFRCRLYVTPVLAQWLDNSPNYEPLYIGARRVVRTQFLALVRIERLFQERAEYRGIDLLPCITSTLAQRF